jgi:hypothetical protein
LTGEVKKVGEMPTDSLIIAKIFYRILKLVKIGREYSSEMCNNMYKSD